MYKNCKFLGYFEICILLIERGAFIDAQDQQLNTPLHYLSENGNDKIIEYILSNFSPNLSLKNSLNLKAY